MNTYQDHKDQIIDRLRDENAILRKRINAFRQKRGDVPIEYLGLSRRSENGLRNLGVDTITAARELSERQIREMPNLGKKSYHEIMYKLLCWRK